LPRRRALLRKYGVMAVKTKSELDKALDDAGLGCTAVKLWYKDDKGRTKQFWCVSNPSGVLVPGVGAKTLGALSLDQWIRRTKAGLFGPKVGSVSSAELASSKTWSPKDLLPSRKEHGHMQDLNSLLQRKKALLKQVDALDEKINRHSQELLNMWETKIHDEEWNQL